MADNPERKTRARTIASVSMAVLGCLLLVVSVLGVWVRNLVLDTDRYVETIAPLAGSDEIQAALADQIANAVSDALDLQALAEEVLPERAGVLAAPIAAGADSLIHNAAERVVTSDRFEAAWVQANTTAHDALVAALTGKDEGVLTVSDGQVVLSLRPLVERTLELVDERFGTDISSRVNTADIDAQWVLIDSAQLRSIQDSVRIMSTAAWVLVALTVLLFVASVLVAAQRRRALLRAGLLIAVAMVLILVAMSVGRGELLSSLPSSVQHPGAFAVVFDTVTSIVLRSVRIVAVVGLVVALGAWLAGPGNIPSRLRAASRRGEPDRLDG